MFWDVCCVQSYRELLEIPISHSHWTLRMVGLCDCGISVYRLVNGTNADRIGPPKV